MDFAFAALSPIAAANYANAIVYAKGWKRVDTSEGGAGNDVNSRIIGEG